MDQLPLGRLLRARVVEDTGFMVALVGHLPPEPTGS